MVALVTAVTAAALAGGGPPPAFLDAGPAPVRLAVASYCWRDRCAQPLQAAPKPSAVTRRTLVRFRLAFAVERASLVVAGRPVQVVYGGRGVRWRANRGGGFILTVESSAGWVAYVGRIRVG